jgi:hypothetical protein
MKIVRTRESHRVTQRSEHNFGVNSTRECRPEQCVRGAAMISMRSFFRNTPGPCLRAYFDRTNIGLPERIDWSARPSDLAKILTEAFDDLGESSQLRMHTDAERIVGLSDEAGQTALYGVVLDRASLDNLPNGHARSISIFINDPAAFRHAEEVRYTDEHRRGRSWDGFVGPKKIAPRKDPESVDRLKAAIRDHFNSPNVHIEVFERTRPRHQADSYTLTQVSVYRDGRPDEVLEFIEGDLDRKERRPVSEASVTYESTTGAVEVVGEDRESRSVLARFFVAELLGQRFANKPLPLRRYDLSGLARRHQFPTDPEDRIEAVHVTELRLSPIDSGIERVTLECARNPTRTIWQMASERFGLCNPLHGDWYVTRAKFTIAFRPEQDSRQSRLLPVVLKWPHGCDLKDGTEMERVVGEKYLQRWSLLKDV